MESVYLACAIVGGTLLLCQFVMTLFGLSHDHDLGADHDLSHDTSHEHAHDHSASWFVGIITFRTMVAAMAFFGVAGRFAQARGMESLPSLGLALIAGAAAMFLVASVMKSFHKLRAEGTARIDRAIGASGTVYLSIPPQKSGLGKVTLTLQNRTMEYQAVTCEPTELQTGTKVVAVAVVGPGTVEVVPVPSSERVSHA